MNVNLNLQDPAIQEAVQAALIAGLSEPAKAAIIGQAVAHLVTPERSVYGSDTSSPLAKIMRQAAEGVAREWAREELKNPDGELRKTLNDLIRRVTERLVAKATMDHLEKLFEKFFDAALNKLTDD